MTRTSLRLLAAVVPLFAACGGAESQLNELASAARSAGTLHAFCPGQEIPVWTGAGNPASATRAGTLVLGSDTATLTLDEGVTFAPTALHLQFADTVAGFPVTSIGNPIPGQFACQFAVTPVSGQTVYTFDLGGCPLVDTDGDGLVLAAAHFGLQQPGAGSVGSLILPTSPVSLALTRDDSGAEASFYFSSIVVSGGGALDGTYAGWCTDPNRGVPVDVPWLLYSTYDSAGMAQVAALLDPPTSLFVGKLPAANYLVNHYVLGVTPVTPMDATCTPLAGWETRPLVGMWTIQQALWYLLTGQLFDADPYAVGIACEATANGATFVPGCNESLLIFALPIDAQGVVLGQSVLIEVPVPCGAPVDATAWADGLDGKLFPFARQWGTYFQYDLVCGP